MKRLFALFALTITLTGPVVGCMVENGEPEDVDTLSESDDVGSGDELTESTDSAQDDGEPIAESESAVTTCVAHGNTWCGPNWEWGCFFQQGKGHGTYQTMMCCDDNGQTYYTNVIVGCC